MLAPFFLNAYWVDVLNNVGLYAILGLSLNIILGHAGMFHMGHAAFCAMGAYTTAIINTTYQIPVLWFRPLSGLGAYTCNDKVRVANNLKRVYALFPRLGERVGQLAGTLSGGEQQMLAIGRALMGNPKILLLDEPSLGLAPLLVKAIFETIREINRSGLTVVLVEQNARAALKLAHRGYVMEVGRIVLEDTADRLLADPEVQKAYLGGAR